MENKQSVASKLLKRVINGNLSFTTIGSGVAIVTTWVLYSKDVLVKPTFLVWAGIILTGAGLGLIVDGLQKYFKKYI